MTYGLLAGVLASLFSFLVNTCLINRFGDRVLLWYVPVIEELSKTGFAYAVNGNIVVSHMAFGTVEALYDFYNTPDEYSFTAALLSILSHAVLGTVSYYTAKWCGNPVPAVMLSTIMHGCWNRFFTG